MRSEPTFRGSAREAWSPRTAAVGLEHGVEEGMEKGRRLPHGGRAGRGANARSFAFWSERLDAEFERWHDRHFRPGDPLTALVARR